MKILLSAYACRPHSGSEAGIGWHWAIEIAKLGHEVWVLTHPKHQPYIEAELEHLRGDLSSLAIAKQLQFIYYQLPRWLDGRLRVWGGIHLHYIWWQWGASGFVKGIHEQELFDLVHHITFVGIRLPSFMGRLGIPFIFGPVAGGERAPWALRSTLGWRGWLLEAIRDLWNCFIKADPLMWQTFYHAKRIIVTSEQTAALLPASFRHKSHSQLAIGWEGEADAKPKMRKDAPFRLLYAGRFLYWKGMHLGLPAFCKLLKEVPDARLTLIGQGTDEARLRRLANRLGIGQSIDWVPWLERDEVMRSYEQHHVLLFPSLHDSGGMVILEALAHALPVVCLGLGGPGTIVNQRCGVVVPVEGLSHAQVIEKLAEALLTLAENEPLRLRLSEGAVERVKAFSWSKVVTSCYEEMDVEWRDRLS